MRNKYVNNENNVIFSGMQPAQRAQINSHWGIQDVSPQSPQTLPDFLKVAPKTNKNGKPLDVPMSIQQNSPMYQR
jgi:hypothetical protein